MRFLAPPTPVVRLEASAGSIAWKALFVSLESTGVGCALCHTPSLPTGVSPVPQLANQTANLYSDLLVHHMGTLADDIIQGSAGPDEFRTAPLWGLGQRLFFLHDGRASNLVDAIQAHSGEASTSVVRFNALSTGDKQDILNFLRSL
jgi:CxxC motif-containing protein (DUF1111 family)